MVFLIMIGDHFTTLSKIIMATVRLIWHRFLGRFPITLRSTQIIVAIWQLAIIKVAVVLERRIVSMGISRLAMLTISKRLVVKSAAMPFLIPNITGLFLVMASMLKLDETVTYT
ncbi:hypothetical protein PO250_11040 [Limosilactobacillus mucosae]|uniref:Uncharacterized protein n=1 Tax=Limosilactobacillus mucosae TaxID=97478 RepID=A0AAJ1HU72_LIMMU|nr:hypothetical protein [Limosilactobacillus mucosae]MDC2830806.1 hypothetical protein [Limosilactobacillus mucosae]MDC2837721.1 hypothetical protein [Limosilactobacillus mucosae]MDC2853143.1 hypothetical protein [Limosilactobacillus mucosae]